jgi:membrane protease YdiL (CAAX protease family)
MLNFLLLISYATIPPAILAYLLKLIYKKRHRYGWHLLYFAKFLITLSFLPLLYIKNVNLGLVPQRPVSLICFSLTLVLSILLVKPASKRRVFYLYSGGVFAAFMEEILFRGVLWGLSTAIWQSGLITIIVTSLAFGFWHLKNYHRSGKESTIKQFFYTALYAGPLFAVIRMLSGDIYVGIFVHFVMDTLVALAPDWMRGWLVFGGRGKNDFDQW